MGIKILGVRKMSEQGNLLSAATKKTASDYCHEQSIESSFSARYSKWDDNQVWSSQEWKADTSMCDRAKRCDLLEKTRESQPGFFREKTQHDWNSANPL